MAEMKCLGMQNLCKDFQRFNQPGPGSVEILVAVGQEYAILLDGAQPWPIGLGGERTQFMPCVFDVEAARQDQKDIRVGLADHLPCHPRRMLAGLAK